MLFNKNRCIPYNLLSGVHHVLEESLVSTCNSTEHLNPKLSLVFSESGLTFFSFIEITPFFTHCLRFSLRGLSIIPSTRVFPSPSETEAFADAILHVFLLKKKKDEVPGVHIYFVRPRIEGVKRRGFIRLTLYFRGLYASTKGFTGCHFVWRQFGECTYIPA